MAHLKFSVLFRVLSVLLLVFILVHKWAI